MASTSHPLVEQQVAEIGVTGLTGIHRNLGWDAIFEHETANNEGTVSSTGCFIVETGKYTGRSPKDKWIVKQAPSEANVDWGQVNQPIDLANFNHLHGKICDHMKGKTVYVFDGFVGCAPKSRRSVRFITEYAWQHHFVTCMFVRPSPAELETFKPDFTIINGCNYSEADWANHGLHSDAFVVFNIESRLAIIGGTRYGGEMKKGIFSMMHYWLPLEGSLSMHCSANVGDDGKVCLFFGLSGTGKTTLSADMRRHLIGDDEHGWDDDGVFNFEGGCYAKCANLNPAYEPEIFAAIKRNALLENVVADAAGVVDFTNISKTENTRVAYPLDHIPNTIEPAVAGHPSNIIFLACDAFGILPPVSKLSPEQTMYQFLSGYTAKVAGTERGVTEPTPTFSACFGAAFLTLHPTVYAELLGKRMKEHGVNTYLVNTGWSGGPAGVGKRMKLPLTRACIDAIHSGEIEKAEFRTDDVFQFQVPLSLAGVPDEVLAVKPTWADQEAYERTRLRLATMFRANFKQFVSENYSDFSSYGPVLPEGYVEEAVKIGFGGG